MKRNKIFVAVTGGIGSGKSSAAQMIGKMGYTVVSADRIAKNIYSEPKVLQAVKISFPDCVSESEVDRKLLAAEVFSDPMKLRRLEAITHPVIMRRLLSEMDKGKGQMVFAEVPLLFESGSESDFDEVIVLMRDREQRIASVKARDGLSDEEVISRIENQYNYEKNPIIGHTVIYNDGDLSALEKQVHRVVNEIEKKYRN